MTWFLIKNTIKKVWLWLKEHWQLPFLFVWSVLIYVLTRRNSDSLIEVIEAKRDSYKKQIEILRSTHNDELLKRENLIKEYEEAMNKINEEMKKEEKDLSEKQKEELKELVIKSRGNPEEIIRKIEQEFGIRYVK